MDDRLITQAEEIERLMMRQLGALYGNAMLPVLDKHKRTLDKLRAMAERGNDARIRTLLRTSGLLDDASEALALAGRQAAIIIRSGVRDIREEASHEQNDGGEA